MYLFTLYLQDYSNEIVEVLVILEIILESLGGSSFGNDNLN